jgi:hypothetical protein
MFEHLAVAFLSASLLSSIGMKKPRVRPTWLELVALVLAAGALVLAIPVLPDVIFYPVLAVSLVLNLVVCVLQFRHAIRNQSRSI